MSVSNKVFNPTVKDMVARWDIKNERPNEEVEIETQEGNSPLRGRVQDMQLNGKDFCFLVQPSSLSMRSKDIASIRVLNEYSRVLESDALKKPIHYAGRRGSGHVAKDVQMTADGLAINPSPRNLLAFWDYKNDRPDELVEIGFFDSSDEYSTLRGRLKQVTFVREGETLQGVNVEIQPEKCLIRQRDILSIGVVGKTAVAAAVEERTPVPGAASSPQPDIGSIFSALQAIACNFAG